MSSSSDAFGRRASVLEAPRPVASPAFPDLATPESSSKTRTEIVDHRAVAWQQGYTDGYASGQAEATAQAAFERQLLAESRTAVDALLVSLQAAVEDARRRDAVTLDGAGMEIARVALVLAEAVIGREVTTGADALARGLALVPPSSNPVARLHPDDLEGLDAPDGVTVVADPTVERGGCLIDIEDTTIDAQLTPALERARSVLLGTSQEAW